MGGTSSGAAVVAALKKFWPDYTKGANGTFEHLLNLRNDELGYAKANARRGLLEAQRNGTDDPTTKVHELVDYLQVIKSGCFKPRTCLASNPAENVALRLQGGVL